MPASCKDFVKEKCIKEQEAKQAKIYIKKTGTLN
jgi:hypothetical protein